MHRGADERRHPGELVALSGLKAGDRVLDLIPGDGYWTRIFSHIVGGEGRVYAVWPKNYADMATGNVATLRQIAASPAYGNVEVEVQPTPILTAREPLDMVWTSQNYHDYPDEFMGRTDPAQLNRAVFAMLKPGGTYFIIDHAAAPGSGMRDTERLHRIDPATVRRQVEAAGFEYLGSSDVLRNPADDRSAAGLQPEHPRPHRPVRHALQEAGFPLTRIGPRRVPGPRGDAGFGPGFSGELCLLVAAGELPPLGKLGQADELAPPVIVGARPAGEPTARRRS